MGRPILNPTFVVTCITFLVSVCAVVSAQPEVELYFQSASFVDAPPGRVYLLGGAVEVACEVTNRGDISSSPYTVDVYLREHYYLCDLGRHIGSVTRDGLAVFEVDSFTLTATLPDEYRKGRAYVDLVATCIENPFCDWENSACAGTIRIAAACPDLVVTGVDAPDGLYAPGGEINVAVTVKNAGGVNSGPYGVEVYANDRSIGSVSRGDLPVNGVDSFEVMCVFPEDLPDGEYAIEVAVAGSDDDNWDNNRGYDPSEVSVRILPDLAVQSVDVTDGQYSPGDEIAVRCVVGNTSDRASDHYTVLYYLSKDQDVASHDYLIGSTQRDGLAPGEQDDFDTVCELPPYTPEGDRYVGVMITCPVDGIASNNRACDPQPVRLVHPAGYVCGQAKYRDLEGTLRPIRFARVRVYDATDESIGYTHTDADGNYGFRLPDEATTGSKFLVRVYTRGVSGAYAGTTSAIGDVVDEVHKQPHPLRSDWQPYAADASATVHLTAPADDGGAFMVFDSIVEGFHKAKTFFDVELPPITTYWPSADGGTYYYPEHGIYISQDDRGDRDVIMHEYGHYLTDAHDFAEGAVGEDPIHYWNRDLRSWPSSRTDQEARNLAFRESWATIFSIATQYGDSSYPYSGDSRYQDVYEGTPWVLWIDLEEGTGGRQWPGEFYENMNCCALWDIFDDHDYADDDQDTLSDLSLTKIWTISLAAQPEDILDFWNTWFDFYEHEAEITRIFRDHKIVFKHPVPSLAADGFETGDFSAFEWTRTGDAMWAVTAEPGCQGAYCAWSGDVGDNERSTLTIKVVCDDGWLKFWRKVSSEMGWDRLQFFVDETKKADWSGELDWQHVEYPIAAGPHTFTWTYLKDSSSAAGDDAAWLDDVEFPVWHTEEP